MGGHFVRRKKSPYRWRPVSVPLFLAAGKVLAVCLCLFLFLMGGKLLVGCFLCAISPGGPAIDPARLLIEVTDLPPGWTVCESGKYLAERASPNLTEGAEEVAFVAFCFAKPPIARAGQRIYRYCSEGKAVWEWEHNPYIGKWLPGAEDRWQTPGEVKQIDIRADRWRVGCSDQRFRNEVFCSFSAQYDEYLVSFSATIGVKGQELITVSELVSILEEIDRKMVERNALVTPR